MREDQEDDFHCSVKEQEEEEEEDDEEEFSD